LLDEPGAADGRRDQARITQRDEREERREEKLKSIAAAVASKGRQRPALGPRRGNYRRIRALLCCL
jgi:hypothetical protein